MRIVLIGSGNVATILGKKLHAAGNTILQVMSPSAENARSLATTLHATHTDKVSGIRNDGDLYLIATSDDALSQLSKELRLKKSLVAHTAGAVPLDILKPVTERRGVFYPLQSLRKELPVPAQIPLMVDGSDAEVRNELLEIAKTISGTVKVCGDSERLTLHLAGVLVNNFPNYLYALTEAYLNKNGTDFQLLLPLILETAERLRASSPSQVQTGPAVRGDLGTIASHEALLEKDPELREWYRLFSEKIRAHFAGES